MPTLSRSPLTTWLLTLDEEQLHRLLLRRPDVAVPPVPRSMGELAARLQRPGSVITAMGRLPLPCLQVAETLAALGDRNTPFEPGKPPISADRESDGIGMDDILARLADHALVWPDESGRLRMVSGLRDRWEAPLGLDRPLAELLEGVASEQLRIVLSRLGLKPPPTKQRRLDALLDHHASPERLRAVIAGAPAKVRELLERYAAFGGGESVSRAPFAPGVRRAGTSDPVRWAVERGLLIQDLHGYREPRMPAEVAHALRGPHWRPPFDPVPPMPTVTPVTGEEIARETAAAAGDLVTRAISVLGECALRPPTCLRTGGVGVRELSRIGKAADCDESMTRLVLECADAAGLLARDDNGFTVTTAYDAWTGKAPAEQVADLIRAWWDLPATPTTSRDGDGRPLPALTGKEDHPGCVQARRGLLAALESLPAGHGAARPQTLGPLIVWHRPFSDATPQEAREGTPFAAPIREAGLLGVLVRGALSPLGEALTDSHAEDAEELTRRARQLLPPATDTARFGSDLTAVVLGTPSGRLKALLDSMADREARGAASLWRFSGSSIRRALDAGHRPEEIESDLAALTDRPLPQPLTYLITDTARRHGHLRVISALCVIQGRDAGLVAEIEAHRRLARLGLRRVAPTVLVATTAPNDVLAALRAEGYAPMGETAAGELRVERPSAARAVRPTHLAGARRGPVGKPVDPSELRRLAAALLSDPEQADPEPHDLTPSERLVVGCAPGLSPDECRRLAHAVDEDEPITITYRAASGAVTIRTISELELDPPHLYAWCHLRESDRVFALSRIREIRP
ncbi:WYL domain-containing protein [Streptomyces sp. ST2-7A]|uniref:WYL domain-containing protein n=1 Tax=Streptomyces sp. ST2-7A TaxID=2907214 RepID=UPI001F43A4B2|nr:WYL domain-containing protein [Streptomyces sp. ST2-7A]MCE7082924.1 helicase C-terminal domain-containing protein [Streptomyces sp. ST2-7A]